MRQLEHNILNGSNSQCLYPDIVLMDPSLYSDKRIPMITLSMDYH